MTTEERLSTDTSFEAIDLLRDPAVDWSYLSRRGSVAPDRLAALLHFARSEKIAVPDRAFSS